jgi:hypothetical protein
MLPVSASSFARWPSSVTEFVQSGSVTGTNEWPRERLRRMPRSVIVSAVM